MNDPERTVAEGFEPTLDDLVRLIDTSASMLGIVDFAGTVLWGNAAYERAFGYSLDELRSQPYFDLIHPDDLPRVFGFLERLATGEDAGPLEVRVRHKSGTLRHFVSRTAVDSERGLIYVSGVDATEERVLVDKLQQRATIAEAVSAFSREIGTCDLESMAAVFNESMAEVAVAARVDAALLWRADRDDAPLCWPSLPFDAELVVELIGRRLGQPAGAVDVVGGADRRHGPALTELGTHEVLVVSLGRVWAMLFAHDDGPSWSPSTVSALSTVAQLSGAAVARASAETRLVELVTELAIEREGLETFASAVARDLRSPMTALRGAVARVAEVMRARSDISADVVDMCDRGERSLDQMTGLIDDLASLARGQAGATITDVDLGQLLAEIAGELDLPLGASGGLSWSPDLPVVRSDRRWLRLLMHHLIGFLIERSPGSAPTLRVEAAPERAGGEAPWIIEIDDDGPSIPLAARPALFRAVAVDGLDAGALSLVVCGRIVAALGGRIWVEDGLDGGNRVRFTLGPSAAPG